MKNFIVRGGFSILCLLGISCNQPSPEKYFEVAVLNSNMLTGFAHSTSFREFESPSVKLVEGKNETAVMTRNEIVTAKLAFCTEMLQQLNELDVTEDTKAMLETSKSLYQYVQAIYKNEYAALARLYDTGAATEHIELTTTAIHEQYYAGFDKIYSELIRLGKIYASRHNIKVSWGTDNAASIFEMKKLLRFTIVYI